MRKVLTVTVLAMVAFLASYGYARATSTLQPPAVVGASTVPVAGLPLPKTGEAARGAEAPVLPSVPTTTVVGGGCCGPPTVVPPVMGSRSSRS
jgi:hypothetical protein